MHSKACWNNGRLKNGFSRMTLESRNTECVWPTDFKALEIKFQASSVTDANVNDAYRQRHWQLKS